MKVLNYSGLVLFLLLTFSLSVFSQASDTIGLNTILARTNTFADLYPQEKIHLHFDKPYYAVGDTIWFKAYVTTGLHTLTPLSKVIYVDVINQDTVVQTLKLPLNDGLAWGNIALSSSLYRKGNYHVSAYTRWMINFGESYFFRKNISVGNSQAALRTHISFSGSGENRVGKVSFRNADNVPYSNKKVSWQLGKLTGKGVTDQNGFLIVTIPNNAAQKDELLTTALEINNKTSFTHTFFIKPASPAIDLQFFPEGGDLIAEVPSKIAFKALKSDGLGVNVRGTITDNTGKVITEFNSQHLGMGTFVLTPENGKTYTATISGATGNQTYALPEVKKAGIVIAAHQSNASKSVNVKLICNQEFLNSNQNQDLFLVAKMGEVVCYAAKATLRKQLYTAEIPKDKLPSGIVHITLFSSTGNPLSERLVFVQQPDLLNLSIKTDRPLYKRRQNVKLTISTREGAKPVESNLSVSVVDESKVPFDENNETTIISNFLLTSDLKGFIEKPNYYFNKPSDKTASDLDVLMLTQGYRRFSYKDIVMNKKPQIFYLPEKGIEITGTLRNSTGMPVNKGNVRLRIPDKYISAYATTNGSGVFKFSDIYVTDSTSAIISSSDYSLKNPMISVDPASVQPVLSQLRLPDEQLNIDSAMNLYLENNKRIFKNSLLLAEVVIKAKPAVKAPSHLDYPSLTGLGSMPNHVIPKERLQSCAFFLECLRGAAQGVIFENDNFYVSRDFYAGQKKPMQVFVDGMPLDANALKTIASTDIESVEIFLRDELGLINRTYNTSGVIVVNSKRKPEKAQMKLEDIKNLLPKPGEVKFMPHGYSVVREFYSPRYSATQNTVQGGDLRTTIYWNPKLRTDKTTGNSTIDYFNSDGRGTYRVTIEGIDVNGNIGRQVFRYKVD